MEATSLISMGFNAENDSDEMTSNFPFGNISGEIYMISQAQNHTPEDHQFLSLRSPRQKEPYSELEQLVPH